MRMICVGNRVGKSLEFELEIIEYINEGKLPSWVLEMYEFLKGLNLRISMIALGEKTRIFILDTPERTRETILKKTNELNLIFHIHQEEQRVYLYDNQFIGDKIPIGYESVGCKFEIREPMKDEDTSKICYTIERNIW